MDLNRRTFIAASLASWPLLGSLLKIVPLPILHTEYIFSCHSIGDIFKVISYFDGSYKVFCGKGLPMLLTRGVSVSTKFQVFISQDGSTDICIFLPSPDTLDILWCRVVRPLLLEESI